VLGEWPRRAIFLAAGVTWLVVMLASGKAARPGNEATCLKTKYRNHLEASSSTAPTSGCWRALVASLLLWQVADEEDWANRKPTGIPRGYDVC